ncbi:MAG: phage holin family protein [Chthoniobacterales bacterium]|nr:phage holin family protein [Chthoniobacterales bacterium]
MSCFIGSAGLHSVALLKLLKFELAQFFSIYTKILLLALIAIIAALLAYLFLLFSLAFALDSILGFPWFVIALLFSLVHLLLLFLAYGKIRSLLKTPTFQLSSHEFQKTFQTLSAQSSNQPPPTTL